MSRYDATGTRGDLYAVQAGNVLVPVNPGNATADATTTGVTVAAGTYWFPLGGTAGGVPSETIDLAITGRWAATVAGTLTLEVTNLPQTLSGAAQVAAGITSPVPFFDVSDYNADGTSWILFNPTLAYPGYAAAVGTGNSVTALTFTLGGTNAGGMLINIPDFGFRRARLKLVCTAGGIIRLNAHGKLGA